VRRRIGPFDHFDFYRGAMRSLGNLPEPEARCLTAACVEIRDRGADAIQGHGPGLFDVHRCGYIICLLVTAKGAGTVLDFYEFSL
jgi:hypothetical protein